MNDYWWKDGSNWKKLRNFAPRKKSITKTYWYYGKESIIDDSRRMGNRKAG